MAREPPAGTTISYSLQYRRCGKAECLMCGPGRPGHGPYWYAFWREDGRARSRYLGREAPPGAELAPLPAPAEAAAGPAEPGSPQSWEPALRVRTLGGFAVWLGDEALPAGRWRRPIVAALFKALLSAPGHCLTRDQAMEALWPEAEPAKGAPRLRATIHRLREVVGACHLEYRDELLALAPGGAAWLDADAFEALAHSALNGRERAACRAALALYTGDYLPEDRYVEWAVDRREHLRQRWLAVLLHAAALCEEIGECEEAARHLGTALAADRCQEGAARALMQLHVRAGRPAQALRVYRRLADALRDELDLAPEPETRALSLALAAQHQAGPPSTPEPVRRTNLPAPTTSFIGRRQELAAICGLLTGAAGGAPDPDTGDRAAPCRLLTLIGPGGVGKTRLALAVADELLDEYPDGVWLVDLAPLTGAASGGAPLVVGTVVRAFGLKEEPGRPPLETLAASVSDRRVLVVLDNCEHLIDPCAALAASLLAGCPALRILATSRETLGVAGERPWPVQPLSLPSAGEATVGRLPRAESVRLFLERARTQRPDLALSDENAGTIAQICARLEGIPLAIELAAALVGVLNLEVIAARLRESFRLLTGGPRTVLPRQRTLRATLDWSYNLLDDVEQTVLRRLTVFAGGCTLEAAEAVCCVSEPPQDPLLSILCRLVRKSLLATEEHQGETRYRLLETLRQYGQELLAAHGEMEALRHQHAAYFLKLAEQSERGLKGPDQRAWLIRLDREHDDLRAVLGWALEQGETELGLRMAGQLWRFWRMRGYLSEGRAWLERVLGGEPVATLARVRALTGAGDLTRDQGDYVRAVAWYDQGLALSRELGDAVGSATALVGLGSIAWYQGDVARAMAHTEEGLVLWRAIGDANGIAFALDLLGLLTVGQGDYVRGRALHEESLALWRNPENKQGITIALNNLAVVAYFQGDHARARVLLEETLAAHRELGDKPGVAIALSNLGEVALLQGEVARTTELLEEGMSLWRELGDKFGLASTLSTLGGVAHAQGDYGRARALHQEALVLRRELGNKGAIITSLKDIGRLSAAREQWSNAALLFGAFEALGETVTAAQAPEQLAEYEQAVKTVRAALGQDAFVAAWAAGRAMPLEEAIALALAPVPHAAR